MKTINFLRAIVLSLSVLFATSCSSDKSSEKDVPINTVTKPGDAVAVTAGSVSFTMICANDQDSITFPIYVNSTGTETLTRRFSMAETEVTNGLMAEVLNWARVNGEISESGTHNLVDETTVQYGGRELINLDDPDVKIGYSTFTHTFSIETGYREYPVQFISWYGAVIFCNWLTTMIDGNPSNTVYSGIDDTWDHDETVENTKSGFRLPTWQEWQFAAKYIGNTAPASGDLASECVSRGVNGGDMSLTDGYFWTPGNYASGAADSIANMSATQAVAVYNNIVTEAQPVKSLAPNQLGLYDMSGNAYEWCFSLYNSQRVIEGGSWQTGGSYVQSGYYLVDWDPDVTGYSSYSFRLAKSAH